MSDNESDYYSDSAESDEESVKVVNKKPVVVNAAKKFGNYIEDESEIDDSEPDDADQEEEEEEQQIGGVEDNPEEIVSDDEQATKEEEEDDAELELEEQDEGDSDIEIDEEGEAIEKKTKPIKPKKTTQLIIADEDDDDDEYEENYLQKFDGEINKNYITEFHPECLNHNSDEVSKLSKIVRDENNIIVDSLHRTLPYLTKYEKARVLGQRAKQIETGAKPLVKVPENIIDGYIIAELELREKKIPFIIKRPIPGGAFEYWNLRDLEIINF
jgi:DNA-directed RNA polymerase I, II, and III subunit RPABC2